MGFGIGLPAEVEGGVFVEYGIAVVALVVGSIAVKYHHFGPACEFAHRWISGQIATG